MTLQSSELCKYRHKKKRARWKHKQGDRGRRRTLKQRERERERKRERERETDCAKAERAAVTKTIIMTALYEPVRLQTNTTWHPNENGKMKW